MNRKILLNIGKENILSTLDAKKASIVIDNIAVYTYSISRSVSLLGKAIQSRYNVFLRP